MKIKLLSAIILSAVSMQAAADKEYWIGTDGEYAHDRNGHCVRTIKWTPAAAIPGCEGGAAEAKAPAATPAAAPAKEEAVAAKAEPAPAPAAAAEPQYVKLSLASGATFALGGSTLSDEGKASIAEMVSQFRSEDVKSVVIEGYTDNTGDASFNQQLSEKRAQAVKDELVNAHGADPSKITTVGYGEANPIADNNTRAGRAKNRRVEIKVDGSKRQL